ncbi:zinc finger protein on ecdysone puffs-like isoform X1 [Biomphalaria glabrata]|uniref:Zinc finger protein on ecdysone puffs-like isoform X1 n=1 Tax=Biomphalaria glabrata TaxID=6526 RepID=A0A9W3BBK9_BIOGL|nr:zinc finger protein on ecdysone puffs-like isoform X1 [Biomphalaria glabrata]XP_055896892.1 zinc finger protein on ecdysone puffs-like isoform X1 [Biomphalaria glabrata]
MNRRHGGRDRRPNYGGDGLLGEGPGYGGGMYDPMVSTQMNQLMLAQQLLQQQAALGSGAFGAGDLGALAMGNMGFMQHQGMGYGGGLGMRNDRKRVGGQSRDMDFKRRRRDSSGRGGDRDRSRGRDGNRSSDGRDRNHSSRSDSEKNRSREEDYDPAEPTEDEEGKDKDSNLYCHVCNVSVYDDESFRRHLNGTKHTQRMNSVLTVHQMKSNQLKSRLKAEEHLRKIEGKRGGYDPNFFCKICNNSLTIPWERHRFSNIHKQRQLQVKRGCGWCKVHDFTNFTEVLEHRETEEHKKNAEIYGKKKDEKDSERSRSRSRERRSDKHRKSSSSRDRSRKDKDRKQRDKKRQEEDEEDLTIPEYNAENPVGLNYIIPVTGFFCKLCHKFYNNEKSAKGAHCQSETHYEKFKEATEVKIAAREKRKAEEAAQEEERKAQEEEAKKNKEGAEEEMKEEVKEDVAEDKDEFKKDINTEDEFEENYDDPLPLEDVDNDGGLAKDDDYGLLDDDEANVTVSDADVNEEMDVNSNSAFLSGDGADGEADKEHFESMEDGESRHDVSTEEIVKEGQETVTDVSGLEEKEEDVSIVITEDDDDSSAPVAEPVKAAGKSRGTARRGRGRGKAKK